MIETDRLILREWCESDRSDYIASCNSEAVTEHLGGPASVEQIDSALARMHECQKTNGYSFWALERRADNVFLGYCGLRVILDDVTPVRGEVEIGWRLRADAWGQGYVSEAALAAFDWAWGNLSIPRIVAFTTPANERSWRVMERIGMARRPDLDFAHPAFPAGHPLSAHITYVADRP